VELMRRVWRGDVVESHGRVQLVGSMHLASNPTVTASIYVSGFEEENIA
jgi:hypothetical protein